VCVRVGRSLLYLCNSQKKVSHISVWSELEPIWTRMRLKTASFRSEMTLLDKFRGVIILEVHGVE
jgi:hypothetical protein